MRNTIRTTILTALTLCICVNATAQRPETTTYYFNISLGNVILTRTTASGYKWNTSTKKWEYVNESSHTGPVYYICMDPDKKFNGNESSLPQYQPVTTTSGGTVKIEDNSDVEGVINGWKNRAEAVGRPVTPYRIECSCGVGLTILIDNVWSSYQVYGQSRTSGGLSFSPQKDGAKLHVYLKGDNRFGNVYYCSASEETDFKNSQILFHSAEELGSTSGTLTVANINPNARYDYAGQWQVTANFYNSVIGGSDETSYQNSRGIVIDGGTIFAGAQDDDVCTAIGGGGNGVGKVTISGGSVTAITSSTGTAIGGGIGWTDWGGEASVNITGGMVYAYNHGLVRQYNGEKRFVPAAAIGGGSSFELPCRSSDVTISGGTVFAQCIGGVAIGGGGSANQYGGDATVKITGGTVTAKSLANTIDGVFIPAGTGIGGGTGGKSGNGGNSTVVINNGTLQTGSLGGGATNNPNGKIGFSNVTITGGDIRAQFIMAAGSSDHCSFNMSGGTIHGNDCNSTDFVLIKKDGGAIWMDDTKGKAAITGGEIKDCKANNGGSIWQSGGSLTISSSVCIHNNTASQNGGGVFIKGGETFISNSAVSIKSNEASYGGGLYVEGGNVNFSAGRLTDNTALNGGGLFLASGAYMKFTGGIIKNNHAVVPDSYSGPYTAYAGTTGAKGFGGGFYIQKGEFASTKLEINIDSNTNFGIYDNDAATGADDILSEGGNTSINIPNVRDMQLAEFSVSAYPNWYEDYNARDTHYAYGLNLHEGCMNLDRFTNMMSNASHYAKHRYQANGTSIDKYLNLKLGYESLRIIISATGLNEKETAYYKLIYHEEGKENVSYPVLLLGDGSPKVSKALVGMPWGNYSVILNKKWTWVYDITEPNADGKYENIPVFGVTEIEFPFAVKHISGDKNVLHDEEYKVNEMMKKL